MVLGYTDLSSEALVHFLSDDAITTNGWGYSPPWRYHKYTTQRPSSLWVGQCDCIPQCQQEKWFQVNSSGAVRVWDDDVLIISSVKVLKNISKAKNGYVFFASMQYLNIPGYHLACVNVQAQGMMRDYNYQCVLRQARRHHQPQKTPELG